LKKLEKRFDLNTINFQEISSAKIFKFKKFRVQADDLLYNSSLNFGFAIFE
jgi:hypothetical protein